jgi:hypothetical protein
VTWEVTSLDLGYSEVFHGFLQSLKANAGMIPEVRPGLRPSKFFPVHYSLVILPFGNIESELLAALSDEPLKNYLYVYEGNSLSLDLINSGR